MRADKCFREGPRYPSNQLRGNACGQARNAFLRCTGEQNSAKHLQASVYLDSRDAVGNNFVKTLAGKRQMHFCDALESNPPQSACRQVFPCIAATPLNSTSRKRLRASSRCDSVMHWGTCLRKVRVYTCLLHLTNSAAVRPPGNACL